MNNFFFSRPSWKYSIFFRFISKTLKLYMLNYLSVSDSRKKTLELPFSQNFCNEEEKKARVKMPRNLV